MKPNNIFNFCPDYKSNEINFDELLSRYIKYIELKTVDNNRLIIGKN